MKTEKTILTVLLAAFMASCVNDSVVNQPETDVALDQLSSIGFSSLTKAKTRVSHEESAALLGNKFYVYGSKTKSGTTSPVFDNYLVEYSTTHTITNTNDWEYSGKVSKKGAVQGVKYWDFSAERFDFVAAAGLGANEEIKNTTDGMRINVSDADALTTIYVADRVTATPSAQAATATTPATKAYKDVVEFQFRRLGAQMRIGFYETIPGYAVKDLVFYYIGAPSGSYEVGVGGAFPTSGTYTVEYNDATNAAISTFAGAGNTMAFSSNFGKLDYTSVPSQQSVPGQPYLAEDGSASIEPVKVFLGTSSTEATYGKGTYTVDGKAGVTQAYKPILPNENNTLKMQLRVDYTLIALDGSGDSLHVRDAYVSVPLQYLQWKPNYSYTYLFKISDNSNGYTGDGGGGTITGGPGRDPDPDNGGGDNDPEVVDPTTGEVIPPYIPDPSYPTIPDPDAPLIPDPDNPGQTIPDPSYPQIPDPDAPLIPNPAYTTGPDGDQHDPSNPVPTPTIPDPTDPSQTIPDPDNPASLFPITFDAVVVEAEEGNQTVYSEVDGTENGSTTEP